MNKSRRHALGQHFLVNRSVLRKIVDIVSPSRTDAVIEIGAGHGNLTMALAERAGTVVAIEKDARLLPALREAVPQNVRIVHADVLRVDFAAILRDLGISTARVAGNLPYSISTPLLARVLDSRDIFTDGAFLLQKEVAERVTAGPGSKRYAPLSILIQNEFETRIELTVSPGSFSPPPKVYSALLSLRTRASSLDPDAGTEIFRAFLRTCFGQRRKKLLNNLAPFAPPPTIVRLFEELGIPENSRAEELSAATFTALFRGLRPAIQSPRRNML